MAAGGSQAVQAIQAVLSGVWARKQKDRQALKAGRHAAGCRGERAVCGALSRLALSGYHHLDDLKWRADPDNRANVDHLVIGPSGVYVVDAKNWAGRIEVRGRQVLQDGVPRDDRLLALTWMTHRVEEVMHAAGYAHRAQAVVCFASDQPRLSTTDDRVLLTDLRRIPEALSARPTVLSPADIADLTELLAYAFPPYDVNPRELAEAEGLLFADDETRHAGLQTALSRPVEDWMVWLHPEQASTVRRSFAGPARVRGPAGTGKTCVALHRVAWLADTRPGRFLVTSYVKTLPPSLQQSYVRLSPSTADRVDFVHLHGVALQLLRERGRTVKADTGNTAFQVAWRAHAPALEGRGLAREYFREEVTSVLKGRDVRDLDAYLALDRVGRRTPLKVEVRREVWALKERYDAELAARGQSDFVDLLRLARDEVRRQPVAHWAAVVVDEVQDLPLVGLQLLYELAGRDRADGLLVVGDGQQAIYPGGFRLSDAGISVSGRAVVLRTNYRNTVEILAAARAVVASDGYDDLDVRVAEPDLSVEVIRHGELPSTARYGSLEEHDAALLWDLLALLDRGARPSDIAVLCATNTLAESYARELTRHGVPAVLLKHDRAAADGVKVGTWFRSKGMEYAHVFLPQVNRTTLLHTGAGQLARDEKAELMRRTLYVAMTRARDTLWTGQVSGSAPV